LQESLFFATEALTVFQWSRLSDRIGRKPVLMLGMMGTIMSMLAFGLSRTFWALVIRFVELIIFAASFHRTVNIIQPLSMWAFKWKYR
jgi:MFS family permease